MYLFVLRAGVVMVFLMNDIGKREFKTKNDYLSETKG